MGKTMIMHDVLTPASGKVAVHQPVDRYRKLLDKQRRVYFEEEMLVSDFLDFEPPGDEGRKCTVFTF